MDYTKPKLIQLIHIAKSQLHIDEESYRAMLHRHAGVTSSTQMTVVELTKFLHELEEKGFKNTSRLRNKKGRITGQKSDRSYQDCSPSAAKAKNRSRIAGKIRLIWIEMGDAGLLRDPSESALNSWVRRVVNPLLIKMDRPLVLNVSALDDEMATLVIERLKKWQKRCLPSL